MFFKNDQEIFADDSNRHLSKSSAFRDMQSSVIIILMSLFSLLKHHLFASLSHHHIMLQSIENREKTDQNALKNIREEIYSNVTKVVIAFKISVRLLQKRVRESRCCFDRSIINKTFNEVQKKMSFQYIECLDRIEISLIAEIIQSNVNYLLKLNDARKDRRIDFNWITRF